MSSASKAEMDPRVTFFIRGPKGSGKSVLLRSLFPNSTLEGSSPLSINVSKGCLKSNGDNPKGTLDFSFEALDGLFPLVEALKYTFITTCGDEGGDSNTAALNAQYTKHSRYVCRVEAS